MDYLSTRDKTLRLSAAEAITMGLSRDGGLFTPVSFPNLGTLGMEALCGMSYQQRAAYIMGKFLEDFRPEELGYYALNAYSPEKFDHPEIAPLRKVDRNTWCLELWHGPTSAFKDMALQMLPLLLTASLKRTGEEKTACILVATSGDTGKAALEGFRDVEQTKIGNFDDAQNGVKRIFSDEELRQELAERGFFLSSANSINWGRILPQVVYYISAYCDLVRSGAIRLGQKVNYCVPTGNFGNILSCYYARKMGVPVGKLICASNRNDVLTDFIRTGVYDRNRPFHTTMSPSMDILISSNLERLLFDLSEWNDTLIREYMAQLGRTGRYAVSHEIRERLQMLFYGGYCSEEDTAATIARLYRKHGYLIDTHTAVAAKVLEDYRRESRDETPSIFVSTASPYKFCDSVLSAIGETPVENSLDRIGQLQSVTGAAVPERLAALRGKAVRFTNVTEKDDMAAAVKAFLQ